MAYMETFFQSHTYLVEHNGSPVKRSLMQRIDWTQRLIGIKGPRGVGKTSFLLQIAAERFSLNKRECLYVNMNSFYFQGRGLPDFAGDFVKIGGRTLLVDQAYKLADWQQMLVICHLRYPQLQIIYTTTSVDTIPENSDSRLATLGICYMLHGLSLREYINLQAHIALPAFSLSELLTEHEEIQYNILQHVQPMAYWADYLHHGYYPFFLENRNFTENLLKAINMMLEIDVLFIKQIELKYLSKLKKLLYLLAIDGATTPNISKLAEEIKTSRATVMNYLRNLEEARLISLVYKCGDAFPKKPARIMLHNTNLLHAVYSDKITQQHEMESFFVNCFRPEDYLVCKDKKEGFYIIDNQTTIGVCDGKQRVKGLHEAQYIARYNTTNTRGAEIPLWLLGFLY